ncbi:MAG TPA: glycosyltransferase family 9 protein [Opitutus sp.]|nr:glycosyltransferase family 9 protein [Opitutus sp.]
MAEIADDASASAMKILVSKPDALGDQVLATSFVQGLRRARPDARIVWHVRHGMEVIASLVADTSVFVPDANLPATAEAERLWSITTTPIVVVPTRLDPYANWTSGLDRQFGWWREFLSATAWDLAVAPVVNRTALSDFTVTASNAPRRFAFATHVACQPMIEAAFTHLPQKKAVFTDEITSSLEEPEWRQHGRMLRAISPQTSWSPPDLSLSAAAKQDAAALLASGQRTVLIAPGVGQNTQRAWPLKHFLQIAGELRAQGHAVRWLEGPQDAELLAQLSPEEAAHRIKISADRLDLLAALLHSAALVVCNDTSYVHLCAALEVPAVAVFGAGQKGRFVPQFGRVRVVQGNPVCRGCQWQCAFERHVCAQDVPYEAVAQAVVDQLAAPAAGHVALPIALPLAGSPDTAAELEQVRDWYQQELYRLRWDGWARLQIINDVLERLKTSHAELAEKSASPAPSRPQLPKLSVIIPMGRPERADGTLQSLAAQTLPPESWEVVVVGVGASQLLTKYPRLPLVPVDLERNLLPPRTRVEGVKRSTGEWYLFVDDDVQLSPDFFAMLARILAVPATAADQPPVGAIGVRLPGGRGTYFEQLTDISNFWSQQSPLRAVPHSIWFLYSAAIVVRAEAYHRSGGFNPDLPNGEDVDLTQRIRAAGYILAYEPALVAYHHHGRDSLWRMLRYFWRNGNAAQYFFAGFGGVCAYSVRTVLTRTWGDLQMNRRHQATQGVRLGLRVPWILLNYLIVESSLEFHWQEYLWKSQRFRELPARTPSDRNAQKAFLAFASKRRLAGTARYALAMLQNLTDPVRR